MKRQLGPLSLVYPIPIVLVGVDVDGQANVTTVGDCSVMGLKPPLVAISLAETHHSTRGMRTNHAFSINTPSTELLDRTDYCGMVSGRDVDKSSLFDITRGELGVPLISECPVNLECRILDEVAVEHRVLFVAEVVQAHIDEDLVEVEAGCVRLPEMAKLDPIIYALDNRYYRIGGPIGIGYQEGRPFERPAPSSKADPGGPSTP